MLKGQKLAVAVTKPSHVRVRQILGGGASSIAPNFAARDTIQWSREANDLFKITQQVSRNQYLELWLLTSGSVFFYEMI